MRISFKNIKKGTILQSILEPDIYVEVINRRHKDGGYWVEIIDDEFRFLIFDDEIEDGLWKLIR